MDSLTSKPPFPVRAIASILFACFSLYVWRAYGHLHWVVLGRLSDFVTEPVREQLSYPEGELAIAYRSLAVAALIWCIWSWRAESRVAAATATLFTGLAMVVVIWMWLPKL